MRAAPALVVLLAAVVLFPCAVTAQSNPTPTPAPTPAFQTTDYRFENGGITLAGRLFAPKGQVKFPLVVLVQGADYDDANASVYWRLIANTFAKNGIGSFSFNKRGAPGSGGKQTDDFDVQASDVAAACRFASKLPSVDDGNVGYYGTSQGGWVVPRAIKLCPGAFVILSSPGGIAPAQTNDYYLRGQFRAVGMSMRESREALALHDTLAAYYHTAQGYDKAQMMVDQAARSSWFAKFQKIEFREDVPKSRRLPTPLQLHAIWKSDPERYALYTDPHTWIEPASLYESLTPPLLIVYGGRDNNVPVEASFAAIQSALRINNNPDVTLRIFEGADHSIQVGPRLLPGYREYMAAWLKAHIH